MRYNAPVIRKTSSLQAYYQEVEKYGINESTLVVEKEISLTEEEFKRFSANLLNDHDFIANSLNHMWYDDSAKEWHCIAVDSADSNIIILIESEGYDYARYVAAVKKAVI